MTNNNKRYVLVLAVVFITTGFAQIAAADIPSICQSALNLRAYNLGYVKGENIVDQAWNAIDNDCDQIVDDTYFKDIIISIFGDLSLKPGASNFVICHYYGYMAGAATRLKEIEKICLLQCVEDGELIGNMASMMYCEISIALGGLALGDELVEGILSLCGSAMVTSCESTFQDTTVDYINLFGEICAPYTEGTFDSVWQQAKHNQCVYNPLP